MQTANKTNHAQEQAAAQLAAIREAVAALNATGDDASRGNVEQCIYDMPLEIALSGTWTLGKPPVADRALILLCTGGPAVRIVCELDEFMEPRSAFLQYQDWGTPWTDYYESGSNDVLVQYCQQFYFGE